MAFGPDNADLRPSRNAIVELLRVRMHVWLANCPDFQVKRLDRKPTQCWEAPFRCSEERPSLKLGRFPTLKLENSGRRSRSRKVRLSLALRATERPENAEANHWPEPWVSQRVHLRVFPTRR